MKNCPDCMTDENAVGEGVRCASHEIQFLRKQVEDQTYWTKKLWDTEQFRMNTELLKQVSYLAKFAAAQRKTLIWAKDLVSRCVADEESNIDAFDAEQFLKEVEDLPLPPAVEDAIKEGA